MNKYKIEILEPNHQAKDEFIVKRQWETFYIPSGDELYAEVDNLKPGEAINIEKVQVNN